MIRLSLLLAAWFFFSCSSNKAERADIPPPTPAPLYYFFPKANVYYDTVNRDYLFLANDGKNWIAQKQIPATLQAMMDKSVLIETPAEPVWKDNENHKLVYSAVLYASPTDTVEKKEPKVVKTVDTVEKKEKKRSGIRRFFDKLFGKKKKD